jgi:hypothetical protein
MKSNVKPIPDEPQPEIPAVILPYRANTDIKDFVHKIVVGFANARIGRCELVLAVNYAINLRGHDPPLDIHTIYDH